jgi:Rrf2 family nitric oxide-sensitive transcriptional repressor
VAAAGGAPDSDLAVALDRLIQLDAVAARQGEQAGLMLTAAGRAASIGWLVRELEGAGEVVGCRDDPPCPLVCGCRLRTVLRGAQQAFFASLDAVTVKDLVPDTHQLLGMPVTSARHGQRSDRRFATVTRVSLAAAWPKAGRYVRWPRRRRYRPRAVRSRR